ncbi:MAG TPA: sulfotransferase family 2 domain-containing protein, partial [Thermoanaerobaculia bacterium]|nr:sulfotransferase family 2 domain-containing protein [Thermoanaerobaculia bacterium]
MLSLQRRFLFIHVPKTGGNSVQSLLAKYSEDELVSGGEMDGVERFGIRNSVVSNVGKHASLRVYERHLGRGFVEGLFRFAIARNPWDRMISFYFSPHRGIREWNPSVFRAMIGRAAPLRTYIGWETWLDRGLRGIGITTRPLEADVDALLRFETLEQDFHRVCERLDIPPEPLPRRNA